MLASADLLVFTERPTPNSRTVGYAMNRITHNAAPKAKGVAHEQSKVRRSGCPRETHCRRVAEASGGKVLRFVARHRRNAPSRAAQVACSSLGRMASCAILAMRTVSRRCLGKSAQITYCRQCAVMVQFFYELHDHGQKVMAEIPLSRGSDPQSPSPNQVAPMWSATSCTPALCMTCQRSTT